MTLSAAMRIGSMSTVQLFGTLLQRQENGKFGACAIGAAILGRMGSCWGDACQAARGPKSGFDLFPEVPLLTFHEIANRNDHGGYSREEIATWLESIGY
jgi:hypothetical protein